MFGDGLFTCEGWWRLIRIRETTYRELLLEFFSTVSSDKDVEDWHDQSTLNFRLGGVTHSCSVV